MSFKDDLTLGLLVKRFWWLGNHLACSWITLLWLKIVVVIMALRFSVFELEDGELFGDDVYQMTHT